MADLGILLTDELALAAFEGRKTETRRPIPLDRIKEPHPGCIWAECLCRQVHPSDTLCEVCSARFGLPVIRGAGTAEPGGRLWVRECWAPTCQAADPICHCETGELHGVEYRADTGNPRPGEWPRHTDDPHAPTWRPSIHMPKRAARTWGRIESVRAERLDAITEAGAVREGFAADERMGTTARQNFLAAWCRLYGEFAGDFALINNPWVWVISWAPISKPEPVTGVSRG